ncbi:MAG TPA: hypothetical protein VE079_06470 [Ensifer sp.]|nr:hypothetical protein [Ensifer sp.]
MRLILELGLVRARLIERLIRFDRLHFEIARTNARATRFVKAEAFLAAAKWFGRAIK